MKKIILLIAFAVMLVFVSVAHAAPVTDTIQAPTGYFVPTDAQKYDDPYYRWYGEDWGWTHNAISGAITSATLNISAFDVDYSSGERDEIFALDSGTWSSLGYLTGVDDNWSYATFTLGTNFFDDIGAGLQVSMVIDTTAAGWAVTLAKSVLSVDGGVLPDPNPNPVPEPCTMILFGTGIAGAAGFLRKRSKKS